jgi:hypothetical protein
MIYLHAVEHEARMPQGDGDDALPPLCARG